MRKAEGRDAEPTAAVVDSQSVKADATVKNDSRGFDGEKKINGRYQPHGDQQLQDIGETAKVAPGAFGDPFQPVIRGVHMHAESMGRGLGVEVACDVLEQRRDHCAVPREIVLDEPPHIRSDQPPHGLVIAQHQVVEARQQGQREYSRFPAEPVPIDAGLGRLDGSGVNRADPQRQPYSIAVELRGDALSPRRAGQPSRKLVSSARKMTRTCAVRSPWSRSSGLASYAGTCSQIASTAVVTTWSNDASTASTT